MYLIVECQNTTLKQYHKLLSYDVHVNKNIACCLLLVGGVVFQKLERRVNAALLNVCWPISNIWWTDIRYLDLLFSVDWLMYNVKLCHRVGNITKRIPTCTRRSPKSETARAFKPVSIVAASTSILAWVRYTCIISCNIHTTSLVYTSQCFTIFNNIAANDMNHR